MNTVTHLFLSDIPTISKYFCQYIENEHYLQKFAPEGEVHFKGLYGMEGQFYLPTYFFMFDFFATITFVFLEEKY